MKIQSTLLKHQPGGSRSVQESERVQSESRKYRRGIDEWFVRWKHAVASLPDDKSRALLSAWGEFHYFHGVFLVSLLWPTPGGDPMEICQSVSKACLHLVRHQRLLGQVVPADTPQHMVFPITWTVGHLALQVVLHFVQPGKTGHKGAKRQLMFRNCLFLLASLESDPANLLVGITPVLEHFGDKEIGIVD